MLTDRKILTLKARDRLYAVTDGRGLSIEVTPVGLKRWCYRYQYKGKGERVILGRYPAMSLAEARVERDNLALLVDRGESPAHRKRLAKVSLSQTVTVSEFAERYFDDVVTKDRKEPRDIRRYIDKDICPALGSKPLNEVTAEDVRQIIWRKKDNGHDAAAAGVRGVLKRLFDYAMTRGLVSANPVLAIPMRHVFRQRSRDRVLLPREIKVFLRAVYTSNMRRQFKLAVHLLLLTMVRKSELLLAHWEYVDIDAGEWSIPLEHTKTGKPHIVFLSWQARELFTELKVLACGSELVLPGRGSLMKPFAHNAINSAVQKALAGLQIPRFTIHDLRRTASTLLHENGWPSDVVEKALNHTIGGVRGIYNRAEYSEQRREMLQFWADYVDNLIEGGKVILGSFRNTGEHG